jgi:hypothetical protein
MLMWTLIYHLKIKLILALIIFLPMPIFQDKVTSLAPLVPIMIHEFGHSLGLRHDTNTASQNTEIMYPTFNLGRKKTNLGPRDIERIQAKYGARNLSQRILDYFMNRRALGWDFK